MKAATMILAGHLYLGLGAGTALSDVTLERAEAPVGSIYRAVLRVPAGCRGSATTAIRVKIPEGFVNAKPMPKAGWMLTTVIGKSRRSNELNGSRLNERVWGLSWEGGNLLDDWYDEFVFRGSFASDLAPGSLFYFPTVQVCGGQQESWIDTSGEEGADHPAPRVLLTPAEHGSKTELAPQQASP